MQTSKRTRSIEVTGFIYGRACKYDAIKAVDLLRNVYGKKT